LVARIVSSRVFRRSARQRELLEYLCQQAFEEPPREPHEQDIGVAVFGRRSEYDTSQDNIVRVHVSELRKKLEEYFKIEAVGEPFILEIPRGSYRPVIKPHIPARSEEPSPTLPPDRRSPWPLRGMALAAILSASLCVYFAVRNRQLGHELSAQQAATSPLWRQFFGTGRDTDLIVADSCLSLFTDIVNTQVSLQDYINRTYLLQSIATQKDPERRKGLELLMSRRYTSMADVLTVHKITSLGALDRKSVSIYFARDYPSQRLQTMNLILVGSKRSNPWVEAFEQKMNFRMEYDPSTAANVIRSMHPAPGEPSLYAIPSGMADLRDSLAVLAFLPNSEPPAEVVILAGSGMPGTAAAGEAFVSPNAFKRVQNALPRASGNRLPYFEALLKTHAVGASVQDFEVLATRVLK
jgi:hypothetical protein